VTIFKKSLLTLGFAVLGFSAVLIVSVLMFMNTLYFEINTAGLKNAAKTLMTAIGEDRIAAVFLNDLKAANAGESAADIDLPVEDAGVYRLTLIDPSGNVLWDSFVKGDIVNHIDREEITAALEGREETVRRKSVSTGSWQIYHALPVMDDHNKPIGVFRLSFMISGFGTRVSPIILPFIIFTCIFIFAAFIAIVAFSRSLSVSLGRLVDIAQTGASLLSDPEAKEPMTIKFQSLERTLRALTWELNFRFEQAKAEGSRLEAILNGMSEAVFAMDSSLILHMVNPKARELFNLGSRDITSLSLLEATRSTELENAAKKALSGGSALEMELTFHTGTEQHFQVFAAPLVQNPASGDFQPKLEAIVSNGVVLVLQEITRLVKLERIRKDFVANVSHELRTPIQLIKGFSENLLDTISDLDSKEEKKQMKHFLEIIHKNAGTMENLTNDLLILANLENGGIKNYEIKEVNIASIINEAVFSLEPQAKKKMIDIIVDCPEKLNAALYSSLLIQALINLIDNGIKYSPPKSKLTISAYQENAELIFEVKDKGIGIPSEHMERIFERFYRIDRARSRDAGGTGLGLSIVRHIAMLHKGKAEVESRSGEGSIFRIRIPVQPHQH
jgi:two-component system phosphate regulon sensor histidine kinase PhoR